MFDSEDEEENQKLLDEKLLILKSHVAQLLEHFEAVQIFVSHCDSHTGTLSLEQGGGNYFARIGQVQEYLLKQDETSRQEVRDKDKDA